MLTVYADAEVEATWKIKRYEVEVEAAVNRYFTW